MRITGKPWHKLFLFSFGVFVAAAFCMKWMESDLWVKGEKFTILGLEIFYTREKVMEVLAGLDARVKTILSYHLYFDFVFMAGVYPGIAALCMIAAKKVKSAQVGKMLIILAGLQTIAWACDIAENWYLLKWLDTPVIDTGFTTFHVVVYIKWILALVAVMVAIIVLIFSRRPIKPKTHFFF